jgi:glutamyl-tRNA reductase (EC 1.2.1.70)
MTLLSVGINYNTAPVAVRERLAFPANTLKSSLRALLDNQEIKGAAILSTCNRTEFYCQTEGNDTAAVIQWLADAKKSSLLHSPLICTAILTANLSGTCFVWPADWTP